VSEATSDEATPLVRMEQAWLIAHFMQHKERQTAIVEMLDGEGAASPERVRAALEAIRA
jgi:hypothetical protein